MIKYNHFAGDDIYLENGFTSSVVCGEEVYSYQFEDKLELAIAKHLASTPKSLNGHQFRFLRRMIGISQESFAKQIDKDVQTVARLEKSKDKIPRPIELVIRLIFIDKFNLAISLHELNRIYDRTATTPNARVVLNLSNGEWSCRYLVKSIEISPSSWQIESATQVASSFITRMFGKKSSALVSRQSIDLQGNVANNLPGNFVDVKSINWGNCNG